MALAKLSELLSSVKDNSYAIGSFNVSNMEMAMGAIKAAEKMQAPIIIQIAEGRLRYSPLEILGPIMMAAAKNTTVPIAVHLDHGGTMETIKLALELGFTSVMFDGSKYPLEENIARTKEVIALAKSYGADVEAEIGRVGGAEGDYKAVDIALTSVEEAKCFAEETKVDALAVAIGTAHGNYKETPKLRIDRLKEIASEVSCPLVLHGGTGLTEQDFKNCIAGGIKKISIIIMQSAFYRSQDRQCPDTEKQYRRRQPLSQVRAAFEPPCRPGPGMPWRSPWVMPWWCWW